MKIAKYAIKTCLGVICKHVTVRAKEAFDGLPEDIAASKAMRKSGIVNYICQGCYDNAYRAEFVGWVNSHIKETKV